MAGKTAVVTGGSSGIGRGISLAFAREGAQVVVNYNSNENGAREVVSLIQSNGGKASAIGADLSTETGARDLVQSACEELGHIDIWVNNAGADILTGSYAMDTDQAKLSRLIGVDLMGTMNCCWAVLPGMQERAGGVIINMSWDLAIHGFSGRNPEMFAAVKAGVLGFSKSLALNCAPAVRVNVIAPGWIQTAFADDEMDQSYYQARIDEIPLARFGTPTDIAAVAVFLASGDANYITGQVINVNGGLV